MSYLRTLSFAMISVAVVCVVVSPAWAQGGEVHNVAEVVEVIDAADGDDPFDFTFRLRYGFELTRVKLTQQCAAGEQEGCQPDDDGVLSFRDVARYTQERHMLTLDAVFGVYRDLQLYITVPVILLDRRSLGWLEEGNVNSIAPSNEYILRVPFSSADRSGVDQVVVGMSWLPFSQERDSTLPSWLIDVQGRFAVGDRMRPSCASRDGALPASTGGGDDDDWFTDDDVRQAATDIACRIDEDSDNGDGPGIGERTHDLVVRMTLSRRYNIIEPYIGFKAHFMFPEEGDLRYGDASEFPIYAETHFGIEVVPWDQPSRQQFLRIGLHFWAGWNREALAYSPLFDVLGTNPNMQYRFDPESPRADCTGDPGCDGTGGRGPTTDYEGMTRQESFLNFGGRLTLTVQAARYVKFAIGVGLAHDTEHYISFIDECRTPRGDETADTVAPCAETGGIRVTEHRDQIDDHGRRFRAEETTIFDALAMVFVQF